LLCDFLDLRPVAGWSDVGLGAATFDAPGSTCEWGASAVLALVAAAISL